MSDSDKQRAGTPLWRIVAGQFLEHRLAVVGVVLILTMVVLALGADAIGKILEVDPYTQKLHGKLAAPGTAVAPPADQRANDLEAWLQTNPDTAQAVAAAATRANLLTPAEQEEAGGDPIEIVFIAWEKAQADPDMLQQIQTSADPALAKLKPYFTGDAVKHYLGTDEMGRDVLMRLLHGARVSLGVAFLAAIAAGLVGLLVGAVAGYYGGIVDTALMRVTDALLSLPLLPMLIIFAAVHFEKIPLLGRLPLEQKWESIVKLVLILVIFSWMTVARVVRSAVLSIREQEYILAARAVGAGNARIILTHVIPNAIAPFLVAVTLKVGEAIIYEAALSFLGLGIQGAIPSWGRMLYDARSLFRTTPLLAILPGTMICLVVISINFVGDGLRDALDPRVIRR